MHRWHPRTVPRLSSPSSWERPILSQMFLEAASLTFFSFFLKTTVAMEVIEKPEFSHLDGWVNTFASIVYLPFTSLQSHRFPPTSSMSRVNAAAAVVDGTKNTDITLQKSTLYWNCTANPMNTKQASPKVYRAL